MSATFLKSSLWQEDLEIYPVKKCTEKNLHKHDKNVQEISFENKKELLGSNLSQFLGPMCLKIW